MQKNTALYIYTGGSGNTGITSPIVNIDGGYNGGGSALNQDCCSRTYASGGGSTDIRVASGVWNSTTSLRSRIIVAAGGGGAYSGSHHVFAYNNGGNGGGIIGSNGTQGATEEVDEYCYGEGGEQTQGGIITYNCNQSSVVGHSRGGFGYGGNFDKSGLTAGYASAGGSGWYGGGASGHIASAGGGSSYISGHTGSVGVTSTSDSSPKSGCTTGTTNNACSITPYINPATGSGYTFTNTVMIDGAGYAWTNTKGSLQQMPNPSGGYYASGVGHSGNGYARITWLGTSI